MMAETLSCKLADDKLNEYMAEAHKEQAHMYIISISAARRPIACTSMNISSASAMAALRTLVRCRGDM